MPLVLGFVNVRSWLQDVREHADPHLTCILVGNKIDLCTDDPNAAPPKRKREVTTEEGELWAKEEGLLFVEASAKSGENVEAAFERATRDILEKVRRGVFDDDRVSGCMHNFSSAASPALRVLRAGFLRSSRPCRTLPRVIYPLLTVRVSRSPVTVGTSQLRRVGRFACAPLWDCGPPQFGLALIVVVAFYLVAGRQAVEAFERGGAGRTNQGRLLLERTTPPYRLRAGRCRNIPSKDAGCYRRGRRGAGGRFIMILFAVCRGCADNGNCVCIVMCSCTHITRGIQDRKFGRRGAVSIEPASLGRHAQHAGCKTVLEPVRRYASS